MSENVRDGRNPNRGAPRSRISYTRLASGLTVLTDPMDTVETVSLGIWVDAGTRHEPAAINGVSHLLEHMAFKGTRRRSARDIAEEMDAVGGHLNAHTARDHTAYYAKVLKDDAGLALDIVADIIQHSTLDAEELAREQTVVVQEIAQAIDTPDDIVFDHFQATAFPDQPLGRPVLGTEELVRSMTRDTVLGYMQDNYAGSNMILAAAGKIDHDDLVDFARKNFAELAEAGRAETAPARYKGGDYREDRDIEQINLVMGFEGLAHSDPDHYALSILSALLGGGMSSRLFQEIREKRGLAYSVYSFTSSFADSGLLGIYAGCGSEEITELLPVLCDQVISVTGNIGDAELERARAQLKASILMGLESTSSRCELMARQMAVYGHPIPADEVVGKVMKVTKEDVARVARRVFSSRPTVAVLGPLDKVEDYAKIEARLKL